MSIYINGIGSISTQGLTERSEENKYILNSSIRNLCIEPTYKTMLPPIQLRRMSKVVKMGVHCAIAALKDAGIEKPDIISTGTAYGCLADTENFLQKMIVHQETMLTPTAFIQSTHNTVSGQIALITTCHGHNFTYVQKGHSFECSLQESMMWLNENPALQILTGGIDEMTNHSFEIIERFGTFKKEGEYIDDKSEGTIAGEGANIFILHGKKNKHSYCELIDLKLCKQENIEAQLLNFLEKNNIDILEIDTCLIGTNGDTRYDEKLWNNLQKLTQTNFIEFKKYCGEYPTSTAFAVSMACNFFNNKNVSSELISKKNNELKTPKNILIYNHYKNNYHSFILLKSLECTE